MKTEKFSKGDAACIFGGSGYRSVEELNREIVDFALCEGMTLDKEDRRLYLRS